MSETIIRNGSEWPVRPALEYLEQRYNIPPTHIRSVTITGTAGEPATITVTLTVETEPAEPAEPHKHMFVADEHHPLYARCMAPSDPPCTAYLRRDYSQRGDQS